MADRGIGQHAFHVLLEDGRVGAQHQSDQSQSADDPEPFVGAGQHGPETRQEEHARLHHGGGVQVGRHRRGRGHGVGQPEMERKLRAFGQRAQGDQHQHGRVPGVGAHEIARRQHTVHVVAADDMTQDQHACQEAQSARPRDGQRHAGAPPRVQAMMPIRDQHERSQAGHFPEEDKLDQVAGKHHAQHRGHERLEEREKARNRVFRRHVIARIQHHQRAHAGDDQGEQPGVPVHAQGELEPQGGRPGHVGPDHAAVGNVRIQTGDENHAGKGDEAGQPGLGVAGVGRQQRGAQAAGKRQSEDQDQRHGVPRMSGPPPASARQRKTKQTGD